MPKHEASWKTASRGWTMIPATCPGERRLGRQSNTNSYSAKMCCARVVLVTACNINATITIWWVMVGTHHGSPISLLMIPPLLYIFTFGIFLPSCIQATRSWSRWRRRIMRCGSCCACGAPTVSSTGLVSYRSSFSWCRAVWAIRPTDDHGRLVEIFIATRIRKVSPVGASGHRILQQQRVVWPLFLWW